MKMTKYVKENQKIEKERPVVNFMGGISYEINPIDTLKMITASSIFGEPQYYRDGEFAPKTMSDSKFKIAIDFIDYSIFDKTWKGKKTSTIMEQVIDNALSYDFKATIDWASTLRNDYLMRLNPQVIMVRAAIHPDKNSFMKQYPGYFAKINNEVMSRADEPNVQMSYFLYKNKSHKNMPNILKRTWAKKIESLNAYEFNKYKNAELGMKDIICICHPKSNVVDEFMKTGKVKIENQDKTWEQLKASGKSWKEIIKTISIPHMALLRNLRGIFTEINDVVICQHLMEKLKDGVLKGKQFPFRYWAAMKAIQEDCRVNHKSIILDTLEECMDISIANMPKLKGKTMCLSDNSGSAWGTFNSEYGSVTVAEIGNLSSTIIAKNSDEGYVGKFGDKLKKYSILKRNGILSQAKDINQDKGLEVGFCTENGIWLFFRDAINKKEHWDNIFIYSDMQAGHSQLYGENEEEYREYVNYDRYIDVNKLLKRYRNEVNPKVNVFMIQTAGYTNVLIPEYGYRTNILYGWTGKELQFAKEMIDFWNAKETK